MQFDIIHLFGGFAILQSIITFIFLGKANNSEDRSNYYLRLILTLFVLQIMINILFRFSSLKGYYKYLWILNQFIFLLAPIVYFYIKSLLQNNFRITKNHIYHFLPFLFSLAFIITLVVNKSKLSAPFVTIPLSILYFIQNVFYIYTIKNILQSNGLDFRSLFTYIQDSRLSWARYVSIIYIAFWFFYFQIFFFGEVLQLFPWCPFYASLFSLSSLIPLNVVFYYSMKKLDLFKSKEKYKDSSLRTSVKKDSVEKLKKIMAEEQLYLDPQLNLINLAKKMSIAPCRLSQIINESFKQSFNSFVNFNRIEESKKHLLNGTTDKMNILEIAFASGFNSKSSFNNAFKKHVGITPTEFRYQKTG